MTKCCITMCGARRNKDQPELTLHRIPRNEQLKKNWLEAIGMKNLNPRLKKWFICSRHFEESCFNRTLEVVRLRDDSLPTIFPFQPAHPKLCTEKQKKVPEIKDPLKLSCPASPCESQPDDDLRAVVSSNDKRPSHSPLIFNTMPNILQGSCPASPCESQPGTSTNANQTPQKSSNHEYWLQHSLDKLKNRCQRQARLIKCQREKIRRQGKKIAALENINKDLKKYYLANSDPEILLELVLKTFSKGRLKRKKMMKSENS